jgi:Domain of unknown function (DUF4382)
MKKIAILGLLALFLNSCSKNESTVATEGNVTLKASAVSAIGSSSFTGKGAASTVVLTDFNVNIGKIKLEIDEQSEMHNTKDSIHEDVKLNGPFLIDLLNPNQPLSQVITNLNIPNGQYEEIKFKFEKSLVAGDMSGKTFLIKGTINGTPLLIWSDKELQLKLDFEDAAKDFVVNSNNIALNIKIQLDAIMAKITALSNQNLLIDGNGDGVIEISTTPVDGNQSIGNIFKNLIEKQCHLDDKD